MKEDLITKILSLCIHVQLWETAPGQSWRKTWSPRSWACAYMCNYGKQHQANHEGRPDHQDPELVHTCATMGNSTRPVMKEDLITKILSLCIHVQLWETAPGQSWRKTWSPRSWACAYMCNYGKQHQANHEGRPDHQDPELVHTCAKMGNTRPITKEDLITKTRPTMKEDLITNMMTGQIYTISPNIDKTNKFIHKHQTIF